MPEDNENIYHDEETLRKVYEGLLAAGIYGQQAVDAVFQMQNKGIFFREKKKARRGRPPKDKIIERRVEAPPSVENVAAGDPWEPVGEAGSEPTA